MYSVFKAVFKAHRTFPEHILAGVNKNQVNAFTIKLKHNVS